MSNELIIRNGLIVLGTTNISANGVITGSLTILGDTIFTASQASHSLVADTASYFASNPNGSITIGAITASNIYVSGSINAASITSSFQGDLDGTATTASYVAWANVDESNTDTFLGTASYATTAATALDVDYADVSGITNTSTFGGTASYANVATTASFAQNFNPSATASYAITAATASYVDTARTASYVAWANVDEATTDTFAGTASYANRALTASYVEGLNGHTASWAINALTASYVETSNTASYIAWANVDEANTDTFLGTASYATKAATAVTANTASYVAWANVDESTTDTFIGTASYATTAGTANSVDFDDITNKPTLASSSAQFEIGGGLAFTNTSNVIFGVITASTIVVETLHVQQITSSVVYSTGSNVFGSELTNTHQFTGSVTITGSLTVDGPVTFTTPFINATASNAITSSYVLGGVWATSYKQVEGGLTSYVVNVATAAPSASATSIETFADTLGWSAKWLVGMKSGSNYRTSEVMASWDDAGNVLAFTEYSTTDVGNTNDIVLGVDINSNNVRLRATTTTGNWDVRATRILI